eukprot:CAMPEP_0204291820 /NCGR_PEP_ID=MMETSP0468-20130131/63226_1 /ASSEMBLY_ACC=CAM_ASM_000383 /TAXON_ID=2969 /ORGANISM="Oxyrrhis marina" /LENGTH=77 /DNA_ID=CAMNT_0051270139 /DNA_START=228 /DNA_END=461 /DNA_ORIENTATION=-
MHSGADAEVVKRQTFTPYKSAAACNVRWSPQVFTRAMSFMYCSSSPAINPENWSMFFRMWSTTSVRTAKWCSSVPYN